MKNKKDEEDKADGTILIYDFGEDFGTLVKTDISHIFVDIHASISPLDPLSKIEPPPQDDN